MDGENGFSSRQNGNPGKWGGRCNVAPEIDGGVMGEPRPRVGPWNLEQENGHSRSSAVRVSYPWSFGFAFGETEPFLGEPAAAGFSLRRHKAGVCLKHRLQPEADHPWLEFLSVLGVCLLACVCWLAHVSEGKDACSLQLVLVLLVGRGPCPL